MPKISVLSGRPIANPREIWGGRPPMFPVLSATHAPARLGQQAFPTWQRVLVEAGELLRRFRADQGNDSPGANYQPRIETREWLEVVHGDGDRFQVGALGLPVVYKGSNTVRVVKVPGGDELRRASPLWLRVVGGDGEWRLLSFAFQAEFLPDSARAAVRLGGRDLSVTDQDVRDVTGGLRPWPPAVPLSGRQLDDGTGVAMSVIIGARITAHRAVAVNARELRYVACTLLEAGDAEARHVGQDKPFAIWPLQPGASSAQRVLRVAWLRPDQPAPEALTLDKVRVGRSIAW